MTHRRLAAVVALVAVAVAAAVPASAHAPRDHRPRAPRMDLEVLVPPPVTGRTSGGARDGQVAVDRFGNRLAVAGPSLPAGTVDSRSRYQFRNGPWVWSSYDEGMSWEGLELLPRAVEALLPSVDGYALATDGTTTYVALAAPTGAVVVPVVASRRGRLAVGSPVVVTAPRLPGSVIGVAARQGRPLVLLEGATGLALLEASASGGETLATLPPGDSCDLAPGTGTVLAVVACLDGGTVRRTSVLLDGRTLTRSLGPADTRGGDRGAPRVDVGTDGSMAVISGVRLWWTDRAGRVRVQDLRSEPGDYRSTDVAVSARGRVAVGGYRRTKGAWFVVVTLFSPGQAPVWADFAYHDPVAPKGAAAPPSPHVSVDTDPLGRLQLLWAVSQVHQAELDRPVLHNLWAVRSLSS